MKLRIAITVGVVALIASLCYRSRACTLAIWTNAALIDHSFPLTTVAAIEIVLVAMLTAAIWFWVGKLLPRARLTEGRDPVETRSGDAW